ncbi:MLO-like protein 2 isoform X2 [Capsella rubella]|uniref:MLO-like protein 2 isoform X2 n=1 Tax=Capsella rubella TaxID=81985 RepID=UPI000CD5A130|nr:MLO-like protein 2 isoform X2 [Capsella rubella]
MADATLEETSTWTVAVVCFVLLLISIALEHLLHTLGTWFKKKHKSDLFEALEKVKAELMLLGFISLLLTIAQAPISHICISKKLASIMQPCSPAQAAKLKADRAKKEGGYGEKPGGKLLLELAEFYIPRRSLAGKVENTCEKGKVPFVSYYGIHQLHIFIFVLAVVHIIYCIVIYALGKTKMRRWQPWEEEAKSIEYQFSNDPERFRFARDTSFGRRHLSFWSKRSVTLWTVCFFRQFFGSITKVDYLTLRHGFITAHFAPGQSSYDFRKLIQRTLEKDFKTVVEISPVIWFVAVLFLLTNTSGLYSHFWLPFIPLVVSLIVGTKLEVIITQLGQSIQEKDEIVRGAPVVRPKDDLFWFSKPRFVLFLIHLVLFTNAFQLAFFAWSTFSFGIKNCFHASIPDVVTRLVVGAFVQILCSYVTLPLYALVTHMGTQMKPTVFNEGVATALEKWHQTAKNQTKHGKHSGSNTPFSSRPTTPTHGSSPIHLLHNVKNSSTAPTNSGHSHHQEHQFWDPESQHQEAETSTHHPLAHESSEKTKPVLASAEHPPIRTSKSLDKFSFKKDVS